MGAHVYAVPRTLEMLDVDTVSRGVLADHQQFLGASLDQLFGLAQDRIGTARDEIAAQAGDDAERAAVVAALRNLQIAVVPRRELETAFGDEVEESVGRHRRRVMDSADHLFILMRAGDREHTREASTDRFGILARAAGADDADVLR